MNKPEMKELEHLLEDDLHDNDVALMARIRPLVTKFLLEEVSRVAGKKVADEDALLELIRIHARSALLMKLIEKPTQFTPRDLKELVKGEQTEKPPPVADMGSLVAGLEVPDGDKAQLLAAMTELAAMKFRRQLGEKP